MNSRLYKLSLIPGHFSKYQNTFCPNEFYLGDYFPERTKARRIAMEQCRIKLYNILNDTIPNKDTFIDCAIKDCIIRYNTYMINTEIK